MAAGWASVKLGHEADRAPGICPLLCEAFMSLAFLTFAVEMHDCH